MLTSSLDPSFNRRAITGCLIAASLAGALCAAPGAALADDDLELRRMAKSLGEDLDVWTVTGDHVELARKDEAELRRCDYNLTRLTKASAPATLTFELEHDTPDLRAGQHSWTEARKPCDKILAAVDRWSQIGMVTWAIAMCKESPTDRDYLTSATRSYDKAIAMGISPDTPISRSGMTGGMKELYEKYCVPAKANLDAAEAAHAAPFKKLLRNDKLRMALRDFDYIMLPGGGKVTPASLAAANVWFEDASPDRVCTNGLKVHVLHRYQFDGQHKLVKVTDREFCGKPPGAALH
ncbi:MAG TPA: hypothetical protein VFK02_37040 [Kofleriaceae bacterium]|nr:hypothetical protein [Kofleriaceae bacterium]